MEATPRVKFTELSHHKSQGNSNVYSPSVWEQCANEAT